MSKEQKETQLQELSFEQAMDKLEALVAQLESGDVPLEQAIELYQESMKLSQLCSQKLAQVERKIEMLVEEDNGLSTKPFPINVEE
ncbi:exodeoxyribonuclease VII small subunit [Paenibacillus albiflavus]|uniref:Exodeoxyribonuclease 7 small subunit n=1 Tax=Paenibacillus albiflavus TaxID=2545760 RepID=A0A4R4EEE5_9BACL|nr:exodeoxyribonuclease VII small subunit [Paenibacillus albiflavus]TCZ77460.1 exodeoxyribonuclease VII small subunit [Paenibacillus albiflavus]